MKFLFIEFIYIIFVNGFLRKSDYNLSSNTLEILQLNNTITLFNK